MSEEIKTTKPEAIKLYAVRVEWESQHPPIARTVEMFDTTEAQLENMTAAQVAGVEVFPTKDAQKARAESLTRDRALRGVQVKRGDAKIEAQRRAYADKHPEAARKHMRSEIDSLTGCLGKITNDEERAKVQAKIEHLERSVRRISA